MMVRANRSTILGAGFMLGGLTCVLAACAAPEDLSAISQYASVTAQSAKSFGDVAADYAASCERYRTLSLGIVETSSSPSAAAFLTNTPARSVFFIANASPAPGYTMPPNAGSSAPFAGASAAATPVHSAARTDCSAATQISEGWSRANSAVLDYVQALGNLAGVDAQPTPNPSPFVAGLAAAGVSGPATQAVSNLITTIGSYFENQAREKEITSFLGAVNPYVPLTIEALERVDSDYTIRLKDEYRFTINQYNGYVRHQLNRGRTAWRPYDADRLLRAKIAVEASVAAIDRKLRASADYGAAVETIFTTHEQLYAASQRRASFRDYLKIVQTTGEPVIVNLLDLAKAVR